MDGLWQLPVAALVQVGVFLALRRLTPLAGRQAALVVALGGLAGYLPLMLLAWPGADVAALHLTVLALVPYALGLLSAGRGGEATAGERFLWGPAAIAGFFAVIILFDGILVAVSSDGLPEPLARWLLPAGQSAGEVSSAFPGVVARDYQKKESLYNDYLAQVRRQNARGWAVRKGWLDEPRARAPASFQVAVADRDGEPVTGAAVTVRFLRPSDSRLDRAVTLTETDAGVYRAEVVLPEPGTWRVMLSVLRGEDRHELRGSTTVGEAP